MSSPARTASEWPGKRLGLPESGPRSIGRIGRRIGALAIDWGIAVIISIAFFRYDAVATLAIFASTQVVFLLVINASIGHLVVGLRLVRLVGGYVGVWRPIARTLLLCLVIPAVIWDLDQRGMHDRLVGTMLVRR